MPVLAALSSQGFILIPGVLADAEVSMLAEAVDAADGAGLAANVRHIADKAPAVKSLLSSRRILDLIEPLLGPLPHLVRSLLFDKNAEENWLVPWHQDRTIAVRERLEIEGYGPWTQKDGIPHVQPPTALLERMLTARLHLDDCGADNGALRVIPGSHLAGKLDAAAISHWRETKKEAACPARRGDVLLMRPLLLHASPAALKPARRRVLHCEFSPDELPGGLEWMSR